MTGKIVKCCQTCLYGDIDAEDYPCRDCDTFYDEWSPKLEDWDDILQEEGYKKGQEDAYLKFRSLNDCASIHSKIEEKIISMEHNIEVKIDVWKDRVKSLEDQVDEFEAVEYDDSWEQRIEKLERSDKTSTELFQFQAQELSELKEKELGNWVDIRNKENILKDEIQSLKEWQTKIKTMVFGSLSIGLSANDVRTKEIKEVLREFFYLMIMGKIDNLKLQELRKKLGDENPSEQDSPERVKQIKAMDRMIEMDLPPNMKKDFERMEKEQTGVGLTEEDIEKSMEIFKTEDAGYIHVEKVDIERLFDIIERLDRSGIYYIEWKRFKEIYLKESK